MTHDYSVVPQATSLIGLVKKPVPARLIPTAVAAHGNTREAMLGGSQAESGPFSRVLFNSSAQFVARQGIWGLRLSLVPGVDLDLALHKQFGECMLQDDFGGESLAASP